MDTAQGCIAVKVPLLENYEWSVYFSKEVL